MRTDFRKKHHKNGLVEVLKVKALSSIPRKEGEVEEEEEEEEEEQEEEEEAAVVCDLHY
jgi:hypothetical protein